MNCLECPRNSECHKELREIMGQIRAANKLVAQGHTNQAIQDLDHIEMCLEKIDNLRTGR